MNRQGTTPGRGMKRKYYRLIPYARSTRRRFRVWFRQVSGLTAFIPPAFPGKIPVASWADMTDHRDGIAPEFHRLPVLRRVSANLNAN